MVTEKGKTFPAVLCGTSERGRVPLELSLGMEAGSKKAKLVATDFGTSFGDIGWLIDHKEALRQAKNGK